jgi:hypothetical protein
MAKKISYTDNGNYERKIVGWEEPPPAARANGVYGAIVEELKENPDIWARLDDRSSEAAAQAFASSVRNGHVAGFRGGRFDARHAGPSVWVRYLGERELDLRTRH